MISIPWLKSEKLKSHNNTKYWCDLNIPAKLFFNNIGNEDLRFLIIDGIPNEKELSIAWNYIYDLYYDKKKDQKGSLILKTRNEIALLSHKIIISTNIIKFLSIHYLNNDEINQIISILSKLKIKINKDKGILEQIKKVLTIQIPSWETKLKLKEHNLKTYSNSEVVTFESMIDNISDWKGYSFPENISLIRFLEAEKSVIEKSNNQQLKNRK